MSYASNGAAIIRGVLVPASEVRVLKMLVNLGRPAIVPEIGQAMNNEMSDASLYSLLNRLSEQRRLVARQVVLVELHGTQLRRVMWSALQEATLFFSQEKQLDPPKAWANQSVEATGSVGRS